MAFIPALLGIGATSASAVSGGLSLGTVLQAAGTVLGGVSSLAAGNYANQVSKMNAQIAEDNAKRAKERAAIEAQDQDTLTLGMLGEQEAAQSASGLSLTGRSQILTRKSARELGRRDALNVRQAGDIEAYNYQVEAANQLAQGQQAKASGVGSMLGAFLGAGASLVGSSQSTKKRFDPWVTRSGTNLRSVMR